MNGTKDLISIVVPVYNVEKFLRRCIDSILSQTYKNYEIIIVDDESPDNCPQICDDYASKHSNIFVTHQKNTTVGVSEARNAGIDAAKGNYITFIDSDDYVHPNLLQVLKQNLDENKVRLSMCSYKKIFGPNNENENQSDRKSLKIINDLEAMDLLLSNQTTSAIWAKLYDIDLFKDIRFPIGKHNEDMFITPLIYKKAEQIAVDSQKLYYYNQESESLCRSPFNYNMLNMIDATFFWKNQTDLFYPELSEKANIHYFSTLINSCQFLAKKKDEYGISKYKYFKRNIINNFKYIIISKYSTRNDKIKIILLKLGLFRLFFSLLELVGNRKYV